MTMDGKILGIPLILIVLVLFIVALVDIPMVVLHSVTAERLNNVENGLINTNVQVKNVQDTLTATDEAELEVTVSPTPTVRVVKPTVVPTTSGEVK